MAFSREQLTGALERMLIAIERREDPIVYGMLLWFAAGTQVILTVERWRARYQIEFEHWLVAWAEFEALSALAGFAWEHPDDVFPDCSTESRTLKHRPWGIPFSRIEHVLRTTSVSMTRPVSTSSVDPKWPARVRYCARSGRMRFWPRQVLLSALARRASPSCPFVLRWPWEIRCTTGFEILRRGREVAQFHRKGPRG
jgi:hypothetical protein